MKKMIHKDCEGMVEFDSFGNYKCKKCDFVGKDKRYLEVIKEIK